MILQKRKSILPFVLGKTYSITKDICNTCNASYGIFGNGTQIINLKTGEEIYQNLLSIDYFNQCYTLAKKNHFHIHVYSDSEIITENLLYMDLRNYILHGKTDSKNLSFRVVKDIKQYINTHNTSIFKLVISSPYNLSDFKKEILRNLDINVTLIKKKGQYIDKIINKEYEYLDITPKNIGKAYALNYLSNFLNVEHSDIMAIGDNVNDIDMIKMSGIGVTLSDSYDEVKKIAKYTTSNSSIDSGFAEAVYKFIV